MPKRIKMKGDLFAALLTNQQTLEAARNKLDALEKRKR
jgi:hypothetical protein